MEEDAESFVDKYDKCQLYGNNMHRAADLLHPVIALWPFMKWEMDIVGPLPQAKGKKQEPLNIIWRNIIYQFGFSKEIVCDNSPQFIDTKITEFFQSWQIKRITSTPYHPVSNGQAESTNKVIINNLKKKLEESKGKWPEVLPGV
ncbi:uncharacterized protein [Nicotiana sylvestris]|uniref:uncharacterized protein n=1 Tax=Nicotiana sylvestris TaxID=4096 RepID=UPI00388CC1EE